MADEEPIAIVDHLHIQTEIILVDVEGLFETEALAAALELAQNVAANIHLPILVHVAATLLRALQRKRARFLLHQENSSWRYLSTEHAGRLVVKRHPLRN